MRILFVFVFIVNETSLNCVSLTTPLANISKFKFVSGSFVA